MKTRTHLFAPEWLLAALMIVAPWNLFFKFFENSAYVNGLLVDYLIPKLYVSDLLLLVLLGSWLVTKVWKYSTNQDCTFKIERPRWEVLGFVSLLSVLLVRQFWTAHPISAIWLWLKIGEMIWLGSLVMIHRQLLHTKLVNFALAGSVAFQSIIGMLQFVWQHAVFPSYLWFGESRISFKYGIATGIFNGQEKVLPYGTTSHPNVLAGFLTIGIILIVSFLTQNKLNKFEKVVLGSIVGLALISLFLAQSITAWITLVIWSFLQLAQISAAQKKIGFWSILFIAPVALFFLKPNYQEFPFINRRAYLNDSAVQMIKAQPLFGVGLNNFTVHVEDFSPEHEVVRFVQPVHHVGLLWIAETGIVGIVLVWLGWRLLHKRSAQLLIPLFILAPILSLDHYLLTNQTGLIGAIVFLLRFL